MSGEGSSGDNTNESKTFASHKIDFDSTEENTTASDTAGLSTLLNAFCLENTTESDTSEEQSSGDNTNESKIFASAEIDFDSTEENTTASDTSGLSTSFKEPQSEAEGTSSETQVEQDFVKTKLTEAQEQELQKQYRFICPNANKKIEKVMTLLHEWTSKKSQPMKGPVRCNENKYCIFCKVHFVEMMKEKYDFEKSDSKICKQKDLVFLVFCIACDKVWIGITKKKTVAQLADFNYGFCGTNKCDLKNNHNKLSLRCMIIDENILTLSEWMNKLCVEAKLPSVGRMSNEKYNLNLSEDLKRSGFKQHRLFSEWIIYWIQCNQCKGCYVGRTEKTFKKRYPNFFSEHYTKGAFHQHTVEENSQCTDQDLRWTVIDSLTDDQIYFLNKWEYVFNKCDIEEKKKILVIVEDDTNSALKEDLSEIVWKDLPIDEIINDIKKIDLSETAKLSKTSIKENEEKLMKRNKTWITKTKETFLETKEKFWLEKIKSCYYSVFNRIEPSKSKTKSASLYTKFFENSQM